MPQATSIPKQSVSDTNSVATRWCNGLMDRRRPAPDQRLVDKHYGTVSKSYPLETTAPGTESSPEPSRRPPSDWLHINNNRPAIPST